MQLRETKTDILIDSTIDKIKTHAGFLRLYSDGEILGDVPMHQVNSVFILGSKLDIPASLIKLCSKEKIPIHILTDLNKHYGSLNFTIDKSILNRQSQYKASLDEKWRLYLAKQILHQKISMQKLLVKHWVGNKYKDDNHYKLLTKSLHKISSKQKLQALMGSEGQAASTYWSVFGSQIQNEFYQKFGYDKIPQFKDSIPSINLSRLNDKEWNELIEGSELFFENILGIEGFVWIGRHKNPCKDPVNSMLSLAYGLLATQCQTSLTLNGLDPYLGLLHLTNPNRPALTYDLMEIYRCLLVDIWVLELILQRVFVPADFIFTKDGICTLKPHRKNEFFRLWFKRLKYYSFTTNLGEFSLLDFLKHNTELLINWFQKIENNKERETNRWNRFGDRMLIFKNIEEFKIIDKNI